MCYSDSGGAIFQCFHDFNSVQHYILSPPSIQSWDRKAWRIISAFYETVGHSDYFTLECGSSQDQFFPHYCFYW